MFLLSFVGGKFNEPSEEDENNINKSERMEDKPTSTFLQIMQSPGILAGMIYKILKDSTNHRNSICFFYSCNILSKENVKGFLLAQIKFFYKFEALNHFV